MAISEFDAFVWEASGVAAAIEPVVSLDAAGVYVLYVDAANFVSGVAVYFYASIAAGTLDPAGYLADKLGDGTDSMQIAQNAGFIRVWGPFVVATGQTIEIVGNQPTGGATIEVPVVVNVIT